MGNGMRIIKALDEATLQARLTARAKLMLHARDILMGIRDDLEDEGDRVYFGSTNHAEMFKDLAEEFDGWAWGDIIGDTKKPDYIGDNRRLRLENERLLKVLGTAFDALAPWARLADGLDPRCPEWTEPAQLERDALKSLSACRAEIANVFAGVCPAQAPSPEDSR